MPVDLAELLGVADAATDAVAPALAADDARDDLGIDTKSSATDMVTAMDRWIEGRIIETILAARPDDGIMGEEGGEVSSSTGVVWVIDPIDGTTNFIRDLQGFSVSIAARVDGLDSVGVVHDPVRGERFRGVIGEGATLNGTPIRASQVDDLARSVIATGFSYEPETRARQADGLRRVLPAVADIRRFGGAAIDCCYTAAGRVEGYFESTVNDWDIAAGGLIAREAGAVTFDGRNDGLPYVVAGPGVFDSLRALVAPTGDH